MDRADGRAGGRDDRAAIGVRGLDGREAPEADQHRAVARDAAADQARVAALGHDRDPRRAARPHDLGDLLRARRPDHGRRLAAVAAGPVVLVAGPQLGIGEDVVLAHDPDEVGDERVVVHGAHRRAPGAGFADRLGNVPGAVGEGPVDVAAEPERPGELHAHEPVGPRDHRPCGLEPVFGAGDRLDRPEQRGEPGRGDVDVVSPSLGQAPEQQPVGLGVGEREDAERRRDRRQVAPRVTAPDRRLERIGQVVGDVDRDQPHQLARPSTRL